MKLIVLSDTHCNHNMLDMYLEDPDFIRDVDVIIHAGDATNSKAKIVNELEMHNFLEWYSDLDIPTKIFVPGNHDVSIESGMIREDSYPNIDFLIHQPMCIDGVNFFGSPYTPTFGEGWAYNKKLHRIADAWDIVPDNTDILITHGPPKGILDITHVSDSIIKNVGCKALLNKVFSLDKLQYHIFGHIHDEKNIINSGYRIIDKTVFINASIVDTDLNVINPPIKIDI